MLVNGDKLARRAQERAIHYGIYQTVNEMALWQAFGSREAYLKAPPWLVDRVRLVLQARGEVEQEQAADMKRQSDSASSSSSSSYEPQPGMRTIERGVTSSSYWG